MPGMGWLSTQAGRIATAVADKLIPVVVKAVTDEFARLVPLLVKAVVAAVAATARETGGRITEAIPGDLDDRILREVLDRFGL
jgi:uncharacterized protein (DUF697 family)